MELSDITPESVEIMEIPQLVALRNDRLRNFAVFYAACGNGAEAARRAGYSELTANRNGGKMAKRCREAIDAVRNWYFAREAISQGEALALLSRMARGNLANAIDDEGELSIAGLKRQRLVLSNYSVKRVDTEDGSSVSKTVRVVDPRAAIESIAKIAGWGNQVDPDDKTIHVSIRKEF